MAALPKPKTKYFLYLGKGKPVYVFSNPYLGLRTNTPIVFSLSSEGVWSACSMSWSSGGWRTKLAIEVPEEVRAKAAVSPPRIGPKMLTVMQAVGSTPGLSMRELANRLGFGKSSGYDIINRTAKAGLIRKEPGKITSSWLLFPIADYNIKDLFDVLR